MAPCRPGALGEFCKFSGVCAQRLYIAPRKAGHGGYARPAGPLHALMPTLAAPNLSELQDALASQVDGASRADVVLAMQTLQSHLRGHTKDAAVTLEHPHGRNLWCASAGFVDLMLALFAWSKSHVQHPRPLLFRLASRGQEVEIGIWEPDPARPSVPSLTLWSQLGARVEQLGASMQVDAEVESRGQWRRLWIDGVDAPASV